MKSLLSYTLQEEDYSTLCHSLYSAESEQEVIDVLNNYDLWENDENWTDYGHEENNVAIIGNQTTSPEAALVEKFTNSIDAVLMKEARLRGIDPKSKEAPQSIDDAMKLFYGVKNKNLKTVTNEIFEKLKQEIHFVATGSEKAPSLAIIDKGEGQTPNMLSETILSLRRTNKLEINFVQGQFNQGGTAVLPFCGTNRLQLVISKRHPDIIDKDDDSASKWGFTIVRRNSNDQNSRNTKYEYLILDDKVPSFSADYLSLIPGKYPEARSGKLEYGTYIKLYNYNISIPSHIHTSLNYHLSLLLAGAKIPIHFYERRKWKTGVNTKRGSMSSILYGHFYRFLNTSKHLEQGFPFTFSIEIDEQHLEVMIVCLKRDTKRSYKSKEGVLFTLNGQTQGIMGDSFFDRKAVGLGYLKDSLMVFIDASKLEVKYREDLFMSNRQHLRDIPFRRHIEKYLEIELSKNKMLQQLQIKRRNEIMQEQANNTEAMQRTISKLIKTSPSLNNLFNSGQDFKDEINKGKGFDEDLFSYEGSQYPSYFELIKEFPEEAPKLCPKNRSFRISFKTDVEDLYFLRTQDRGRYSFIIENHLLENYSFSLRHGKAIFTCFLPSDANLDELLKFTYLISNENSNIKEFSGSFVVKVDKEVDKNDEIQSKKKQPPKPNALDLPTVIEVRKEDWAKYNFGEEDAIEIVPNQLSYDFFINMDNKYLVLERKNKNDDLIRLNELFKGSLFLFALSMIEDKDNEEILTQISSSAKSFARVNIPIINYGDIYKT